MTTDFSQDPQDNPYASPEASSMAAEPPIGQGTPRRTSMDYMQAYTYIFENPNWVTTVLLAGLVMIIPIIGALVIYGYVFEIVAVLAYGRARYPDFTFDRFGPYLMRGLWLFLVALIVQGGLYIVFFTLFIVAGVMGSILGETIGGLLFFGVWLLAMAASFVMMFAMVPMLIRVGLSNELGEAFKFDWIKDFVSKMWVEMILAGLFMWISTLVLYMLGFLALCIGVFFALAMAGMAFGHLCLQLYQVYLHRGGRPVPISTK